MTKQHAAIEQIDRNTEAASESEESNRKKSEDED